MILLRPARLSDLQILEYWDRQPHVIEADPDDDWDWENELKRTPHWRKQLIAELDGNPIGMVQIIDPEKEDSHYWGTDIGPNKRAIDIWIGEISNLNKGYGTIIMRKAINMCFDATDVLQIIIDPLSSNKKSYPLLSTNGFQASGIPKLW